MVHFNGLFSFIEKRRATRAHGHVHRNGNDPAKVPTGRPPPMPLFKQGEKRFKSPLHLWHFFLPLYPESSGWNPIFSLSPFDPYYNTVRQMGLSQRLTQLYSTAEWGLDSHIPSSSLTAMLYWLSPFWRGHVEVKQWILLFLQPGFFQT